MRVPFVEEEAERRGNGKQSGGGIMRGGIREGAGRPKGAKNKKEAEGTKRVSFSVSCQPEQLARLKEIAKAKGVPLSRFILESCGV